MKTYYVAVLFTASRLLWASLANAQGPDLGVAPPPKPSFERGVTGSATYPPSGQPPALVPRAGVTPVPLIPPARPGMRESRDYAAAVWAEELGGDAGAALQSYLKLVTEFDEARGPAAESIYQLGETLRKLGRVDEARLQYARLLREFTDFPSLTELAVARMAGLPAQAASAPLGAPQPAPVTPQQISGNPALRQLILEDEKLVQDQIATTEALIRQGTAPSSEIVPLKRDLLRLKEQLAAAEAADLRPLPAAPAGAERIRAGDSEVESTIRFLETQSQKHMLDVQRSTAMLELLKSTDHPETISTEIIKDPRFERLKSDYEAALAGSKGADGHLDPAVKGGLRGNILNWLKDVYIPELETSLTFSEQQFNTFHEELEKLRAQEHQRTGNAPVGTPSAAVR